MGYRKYHHLTVDYTEKKYKYRREGNGHRCCLGIEFIQFLATLAILH